MFLFPVDIHGQLNSTRRVFFCYYCLQVLLVCPSLSVCVSRSLYLPFSHFMPLRLVNHNLFSNLSPLLFRRGRVCPWSVQSQVFQHSRGVQVHVPGGDGARLAFSTNMQGYGNYTCYWPMLQQTSIYRNVRQISIMLDTITISGSKQFLSEYCKAVIATGRNNFGTNSTP